jgi:SAM-dependent methyltransferase
VYSVLPGNSNVIVDLGCGTGYTFGMLKAIDYKGKIGSYSIGMDIFLTYLRKAKHVYDDVVLCDIRYWPIRKAELALLFGVLEHLEKEEGMKLLDGLKRVCDGIVLLSPFGWHPLHPELDRNPYQKHRSAWLPSELKRLGFKVIIYEHPKLISTFRGKFQRCFLLCHLTTPLSSIISIKKGSLQHPISFHAFLEMSI